MFTPELGDALKPGRWGAETSEPVRLSVYRASLVQLALRRGGGEGIATVIRERLGIALPRPGHAETAGDVTALWMQPETWLLVTPETASGDFMRQLQMICGGAGSLVDQTHGRAILDVSGRQAREVLARICRIDLHPRAFSTGRVAVTLIAEVACLLHQYDEAPGFRLFVPSSLAAWFTHALTKAAAGIGYEAT